MNKTYSAVAIAVIVAAGFFYWTTMRTADSQDGVLEESVVCAQDVRECSDGSYVGRIAPSCEFAACPEPNQPVFEDGTLPPDHGDTQTENMSIEGTAEADLDQDMIGGRPEEGVACTMEAKMCPDGSYVGRTGPKCEFAPCPGN